MRSNWPRFLHVVNRTSLALPLEYEALIPQTSGPFLVRKGTHSPGVRVPQTRSWDGVRVAGNGVQLDPVTSMSFVATIQGAAMTGSSTFLS